MAASWFSGIVDFWFEQLNPADWWRKSDDIDNQIKERFFDLWQDQKSKTADAFLTDAQNALAASILFDQFPRNMFRGSADAYSTDHLAQQVAEQAVELRFDQELTEQRRPFLYMPFMHSENLDHQNKSVVLFTKLGSNEKFANNHRDTIAEFGRFPHRNTVLGRAMRPGEQDAIDQGMNW